MTDTPDQLRPSVGLFGVCADSTWRNDVAIPKLQAEGIPFYNPQLPEGAWHDGCADEEAWHLANDPVLVFAITGDSYAVASLLEPGFAAANNTVADRLIIVLIDEHLDAHLDDPGRRADSLQARRLARAHLAQLAAPNMAIVDTLDELADAAVTAWRVWTLRQRAQQLHVAADRLMAPLFPGGRDSD